MRHGHTTKAIDYDAPATRPKRDANPEYTELRRQHALEMTREVMAGNVTGQGRQAFRECAQ